MNPSLKLYNELAQWWPVLSAPEDYAEEAAYTRELFRAHSTVPVQTLLELGSGGGNNAVHLKKDFQMTLVDLSPHMLDVSRRLNPECEHIAGDMRTVRLSRQFDGVFVHDAIMYMITESDLRAALATCAQHCRPGGCAVLMPDCVRETFAPATEHGGHDEAERGLRCLEWSWDPDPNDTIYTVDYCYLLRERDGAVQAVHDRHYNGLFAREVWLRLLDEAGFETTVLRDPWERDVFVGRKRG